VRLEVKVSGDEQAKRRFARIAHKAERTRPAMEQVADELLQGERAKWRNPGWVPLAVSTRERTRRQQLPEKPLRATGRLERALTVKQAPGQHLDIRDREVVFGLKGGRSDAFYGRFHQRGKGVPKREVLVVSTRTRQRIVNAIEHHLLD
jgi:phage gpG-like protein